MATANEAFMLAFKLMDAREVDRITLDTVFEFVNSLPEPPKRDLVKKVYDEFDDDGSGDIDPDEFLGLCGALEKLTKRKTQEMIEMYTKAQYRRLFDLVDDGDDGNGLISKQELKTFIDGSSDILKAGAGDVIKLFKAYQEPELEFDQFCDLIGKIIRGKPITKVVQAFEEAKRRRLERRKNAYQNFGEAPPPQKVRQSSNQSPGANLAPSASQAIAAVRANPSPATTAAEGNAEDIFKEAFAMMDSRGGGQLSLDNVYDFCDALPNPPSNHDVRKLYNSFDEDGSGSIDSDEFLGFCLALEKLTGLNTASMLAHFTQVQYKVLFDLCDEDGGGSIGKDELKQFLESVSPLLSCKFTANDVMALVKDCDGELELDRFIQVVKKLTVGKSVSQVVTAFEEAKRRRKAAKHYAIQKFDGKGGKAALEMSEDVRNEMRLCFNCLEKDDKINELQAIVDAMQAQSSDASGELARAATTLRALEAEEPQGDLWGEPLHSLGYLATAKRYRKFPELAKPALHYAKSSRINELCDIYSQLSRGSHVDTDTVARHFNDLAPKCSEAIDNLRAVTDIVMNEIREHLKLSDALIEKMKSEPSDLDSLQETLDSMADIKGRVESMKDDATWLSDNLADWRTSACTRAVCVAPYTNKSAAVMKAVQDAERHTQKLLDMTTVMLKNGSEQSSDAEIYAKRFVGGRMNELSDGDTDTLKEINKNLTEKLSGVEWANLYQALTVTWKELQRSMTSSSSTKKDKAIMTQPIVDLLPLQKMKSKQEHDAEQAERDRKRPDDPGITRMRSASPRVRQQKMQVRDQVAHVDRVLDLYQRKGEVALPTNFQRVEPGSNTFIFGTKKIEVVPVDRFAAVKVGGGYLLFDEFCRKYMKQEQRRFEVREQKVPNLSISASGATSYGGLTPSTARTPRQTARGGRSDAGTPRTLVRQGRNVSIM